MAGACCKNAVVRLLLRLAADSESRPTATRRH